MVDQMTDDPDSNDGLTPQPVIGDHGHTSGRFGWWANRGVRLAVLSSTGLLLLGGAATGYAYVRNKSSAVPPADVVTDVSQPFGQLPIVGSGNGSSSGSGAGATSTSPTTTVKPGSTPPTVPKPSTTPKPVTKSGGTASPSPISPSPPPAQPPPPPPPPPPSSNPFALRFFGTGTNDIDRVKIPLTPNKSVDVGGNFTLEWWMKTAAGNTGNGCTAGGVGWINGNIIFDRDISGNGDYGDYGVSLFGDAIAFGIAVGGNENTICSTVAVDDGAWHHVAATRNTSTGQLCLYIDGAQRGCGTGPTGDMSYRDGRPTGYPNSDPFLVIGAEKHDVDAVNYPAYRGWMDDLRISNSVRYTGNFTRPTGAFTTDVSTIALYHFDEGSGTTLQDATGSNPGNVKIGGPSNGPQWSTDKPF